ncbi:MAG: hypothetical protein H8D97_01580 [Proteobacteria bacterium]|nr:hypothetical protein [Pseudomonadota bacterium]
MAIILENIQSLVGELVEEVRATKKKVVRGSKVVVKMKCPKGFKLNRQTNNCERMSAAETKIRSKASLRGAKVRAKNTFGSEQALKQRKKSVKLGTNKGIYNTVRS